MIDDPDTAQARELLQSLHAHVEEISKKVESAEGRTRRAQGHAASIARRRAASLRHELYEAHRLIEGSITHGGPPSLCAYEAFLLPSGEPSSNP